MQKPSLHACAKALPVGLDLNEEDFVTTVAEGEGSGSVGSGLSLPRTNFLTMGPLDEDGCSTSLPCSGAWHKHCKRQITGLRVNANIMFYLIFFFTFLVVGFPFHIRWLP